MESSVPHPATDPETLETWVEIGWLAAARGRGPRHFTEIDLARARLIQDLKHDLAINDAGISVVLDLVDQLHGLRWALAAILTAVRVQPDATRRSIRECMIAGSDAVGVNEGAETRTGAG